MQIAYYAFVSNACLCYFSSLGNSNNEKLNLIASFCTKNDIIQYYFAIFKARKVNNVQVCIFQNCKVIFCPLAIQDH